MIEYIHGELTELVPTQAVIEAGGVGYGLNISLTTYDSLKDKKEAKLYVYESIREDAYVLWGFASREEREMFVALLSVSGVGATPRAPFFRLLLLQNCGRLWQTRIRVP